VGADGLLGWVDVHGLGELGRLWWAGDEAFGMSGEGGVEGDGALAADLAGGAVVDRRGGVEPDAGVAVLAVVPGEEVDAEGSGVVDAGEAGGEFLPAGGVVLRTRRCPHQHQQHPTERSDPIAATG
jgi:hypothetical protein